MKKTDIKKLVAKTSPELSKDVLEAKEKLWQLRRDVMTGKVKNSHTLGELRRDIARMMTVLQNKSLVEKGASK